MFDPPSVSPPSDEPPADQPSPETGADSQRQIDKVAAPSPDLRIGRVEVFSVMAIDLAELVARPVEDRRILQRLRAEDELFDDFKNALIGTIGECASESETLRTRMNDSLNLGGKAVWTDQFVERFAPLTLPVPPAMLQNGADRHQNNRLSDHAESPLHYLRYQNQKLQLFRDGTISYTVRTTFEDRPSYGQPGKPIPPASIAHAIDRLNALSGLLAENFRIALSNLLRSKNFRDTISANLRYRSDALELIKADDLHASYLKRRSKEHTVIFVERFFHEELASGLFSVIGPEADHAQANVNTVLASTSLAGLLNTATWYSNYDVAYVNSLRAKEIGYRDDEIYLSDGSATVISAAGFWHEGSGKDRRPDPLTRYKLDLVLAVEYNVACAAYCGSTLSYYHDHPDVSGLENSKPMDALPHVIDGRAILSHLDQALDLGLLVDHGFTRKFIGRLREELNLSSAIQRIRQRVEDGSTSVGLKSAVLSAEQTSLEGLQAALENNKIQRTIRAWAIVAIAVAVCVFGIGEMLAHLQGPRVEVCFPRTDSAPLACSAVSHQP